MSPPGKRFNGLAETIQQNATLLLVVGFFVAYVPRLMRSLWVDEAGMYWMARGGPLAAMAKTWHWPGQSILYAAVTSFFCVDGFPLRDQFLRVPALAGAALAAYFIWRFADEIVGKGAGRVAAILFLFNPVTIDFATQARPYALAMAAAAGSCWMLYRWTLDRDRGSLAGWILCSALVLYLHYLFAVIFAAQAVLLWFEVIRKSRYERTPELGVACLLAAAAVIPVVPHILLLVHESHTLPFAEKPTWEALADTILPASVGIGALASGLLIQYSRLNEQTESKSLSSGVLSMLLIWWIAGPLLLFAISFFGSMEVFVGRYLAYSCIALTLILAYAGYSVFGARTAFAWAVLAAFLTTANPLSAVGFRMPGEEEGRPVLSILRQETLASGGHVPPVLVRSDLPESDYYDWQSGLSPKSYLFAMFAAYPVPNRVLPLPYKLTTSIKEHIASLIASELRGQEKVVFITHDVIWIPTVAELFNRAGYDFRWVKPNGYYAVVFERHPATAQK